MPLLNYTTTINAETTASQLVGILAKHRASNIMMDYDEIVIGAEMKVVTEGG